MQTLKDPKESTVKIRSFSPFLGTSLCGGNSMQERLRLGTTSQALSSEASGSTWKGVRREGWPLGRNRSCWYDVTVEEEWAGLRC